MNSSIGFISLFFYFFFSFQFSYVFASEKLSCVIHVHTTVSSGKYTFERIAELAKNKNVDVVVFTDHDIMKFEYGIFPFRIYKKSIELPSVFKYGIDKYLKRIEDVNKKFPTLILIPGVESAPYYFWTGSFFKNNLTINNWYKHILVIGLKNTEDYKNLPIISNPYFKTEYNQYDKNLLEKPYQDFINYVNSKEGLTFWAHPEAKKIDKFGRITVLSSPHPMDLIETKDYTGFAAFWEGCKEITKPGNYWDEVLIDYCKGRREKPIWAIGELDYKEEGESGTYINSIQNILTVKKKTREECLSSLREGKFYVLLSGKSGGLSLDEFSVSRVKSDIAKIKIKITSANQKILTIRLIYMGNLIKIFERETPVDLSYIHNIDTNIKKSFYRIEVEANDGSKIISNPLFTD